jgi:flagellar basal body-associated protein FliL
MLEGSGMLSHNQTAIVLLAMNSAPLGLAVYTADHSERPGGAATSSPTGDGRPAPVVKLEGMVVHLRPDEDDDQAERYANLEFDVELAREEDRSEIVHRASQIREAVLGYFLDHTASQLKGRGGMARMKEDLVARINRRILSPKITTLYFAQFLVQ